MEKNRNIQLMVIAVLSFAVLFMTVGFAVYSSTLTINGTATVNPGKCLNDIIFSRIEGGY